MTIPRRVYFGLGTNLGDRAANLTAAVAALAEVAALDAHSSVWETAPMHVLDQPPFLNMAVTGLSDLAPPDLLDRIKEIEPRLGRVASVRYGPRLIDIDILLVEGETAASERLTLPHPRLAERRFVLAPLAEIASDLIVPGLDRDIATLLARLPDDGGILRLGPLESLAPGRSPAL